MVKILGRGRNKKKVFLANTCISVIILPINVAKRNSVNCKTRGGRDYDQPGQSHVMEYHT